MQPNQPENTKHVMDSVLALPAEERIAILNAIHVSLADAALDHGAEGAPEQFQAAWKTEIERRMGDVDSGLVSTVPAELAEKLIRGDARPNV